MMIFSTGKLEIMKIKIFIKMFWKNTKNVKKYFIYFIIDYTKLKLN